jgi:hypothetical protein
MSEAPKKIWMVFDDDGCGGIDSYQAPKNFGSEYIRADLVDGLVEALQHISNSTMARTSIKQYALAALKALEEP